MVRSDNAERLIPSLVTLLQQAGDAGTVMGRLATILRDESGTRHCWLVMPPEPGAPFTILGVSEGSSSPPPDALQGSEQDLVTEAIRCKTTCISPEGKGSPTAPLPAWLPDPVAAGLSIPLVHGRSATGVLFFGMDEPLPAAAVSGLESLVPVLGPLLRAWVVRRYQARRNRVGAAMLSLAGALATTRSADECLADMARAAARLTDSCGALVRVLEGGRLVVRAFHIRDNLGLTVITEPNDGEVAMEVARTGRTGAAIVPLPGGGPVGRNLLAVPFTDGGGMPGVITVFDRRNGRSYARLDREALKNLARVARSSLVYHYRESHVTAISGILEHRIRELAFLQQVSRTALRTGDTRHILRSVLTAVIHREGLGFDRAFLFLHDLKAGVLRGSKGVEVAGRGTAGGLAEGFDEAHSNQDHQIANLVVELDPSRGVLARTVLEKRPYHVRLPRDRDLVSAEVVKFMGGTTSFVTVPLLSEDKVLGVIWVDNLHTGRTIRSGDIDLLVSAAAQAGLIVERSFQTEALEVLSAQMLELQRQLIQWEKMAALGEMAASVAHDIRNPLVSIGGFARRLRKMMPPEGPGGRYAEVIIREVDRLERTLDDVMTFSRGYGSLDLRPVALPLLLTECSELFKENFKRKGVTLERTISRNIPAVRLDERQVRQAVLNILFNAGEAAGEKGHVRLEASVVREGGQESALIVVADNGPGIPPEVEARIFEPFFTTKGTGTGLGLAIAQRAISGHGGEIRVDNAHGKGVTFSIKIPVDVNPSGEQPGHLMENADR